MTKHDTPITECGSGPFGSTDRYSVVASLQASERVAQVVWQEVLRRSLAEADDATAPAGAERPQRPE